MEWLIEPHLNDNGGGGCGPHCAKDNWCLVRDCKWRLCDEYWCLIYTC